MSKFYGAIGFSLVQEEPPGSGIWAEQIAEKMYYGDILQQTIRNENSSNLNDDFTIDNEISIVADSFLLENAYRIRYVNFLGGNWKARSISVNYPRLIIAMGGVYNGRTGPRSSDVTPEVSGSIAGS